MSPALLFMRQGVGRSERAEVMRYCTMLDPAKSDTPDAELVGLRRYDAFIFSSASALPWQSLAMSAGASARPSRNARPFMFGA